MRVNRPEPHPVSPFEVALGLTKTHRSKYCTVLVTPITGELVAMRLFPLRAGSVLASPMDASVLRIATDTIHGRR